MGTIFIFLMITMTIALFAFIVIGIINGIDKGFKKNKLDTLWLLIPLVLISSYAFLFVYDQRILDDVFDIIIKYSLPPLFLFSSVAFFIYTIKSIINFFNNDFTEMKKSVKYAVLSHIGMFVVYCLFDPLGIDLRQMPEDEGGYMIVFGIIIVFLISYTIDTCIETIEKNVDEIKLYKEKKTDDESKEKKGE
jgi:hypothetical protein